MSPACCLVPSPASVAFLPVDVLSDESARPAVSSGRSISSASLHAVDVDLKVARFLVSLIPEKADTID